MCNTDKLERIYKRRELITKCYNEIFLLQMEIEQIKKEIKDIEEE